MITIYVTPFIRNNEVNQLNLSYLKDYSNLRWTVDEEDDFKVIEEICNHFKPNILFTWKDVLNLHNKNILMFENSHIERNQGAVMGKGQKLYKRAKSIIPGGTMLLSKRPEMFLPNIWPSYFSKSKGCKVWDLMEKSMLTCQ